MVHGTMSLKFIDAKQAKEIYHLRTSKGNCTERTQPSGITRNINRLRWRKVAVPICEYFVN